MSAAEVRLLDELLLLELEEAEERDLCRADPIRLMSWMSAVDERDGVPFSFAHLREPLRPDEVVVEGRTLRPAAKSWRWQRYVAEQVSARSRLIFLKGRQIGVTWVVLALDVAEAILFPGTTSLLYRQREDEAIDNAVRWFNLYQSLPEHLRFGTVVSKPSKADEPGRDGVHIKHPNGQISKIVPMTSAAASGHGRSTRHIMLDEAAHIEKLRAIGAAVAPAAGRARITVISTANGRSNPETGDGNEFHRRWVDTGSGYFKLFLPYDVHPDRGPTWHETAEEYNELTPADRQAQFPKNEHEAFALSEATYYEAEDLLFYRDQVRVPLYRMDFVDPVEPGKLAKGPLARPARWKEPLQPSKNRPKNVPHGLIAVLQEPVPGHKYAIGADPASGSGKDKSAAYVIDLSNHEYVAEFHGKIDEDLFAAQLHYLGRMYGRDVPADPKVPGSQAGFAKLAVELGGGFGNATIAALRDRTAGRPAYGNLYRHLLDNRSDKPEAKPWGMPMNQATRPKVLGQLRTMLRERTLPWVTDALLHEMEDFTEHNTGTSPRARDGAHDDLVMAASIASEMYRIYGEHAAKPKRRKPKRPPVSFPWQRAA